MVRSGDLEEEVPSARDARNRYRFRQRERRRRHAKLPAVPRCRARLLRSRLHRPGETDIRTSGHYRQAPLRQQNRNRKRWHERHCEKRWSCTLTRRRSMRKRGFSKRRIMFTRTQPTALTLSRLPHRSPLFPASSSVCEVRPRESTNGQCQQDQRTSSGNDAWRARA